MDTETKTYQITGTPEQLRVLEGESDQLRHFLDFLYNKEFNN